MTNPPQATRNPFNIIVVVAALGYFVDTYDLILFNAVRVPSLISLGVASSEHMRTGVMLLNMQMIGMLIGGVLWGIMGDKRGRISVLFGSIILYSLANILNGFVDTIQQYAWLRLIAGIGLAGELGAGITLVSETMTKETRGYGTLIVVSFGVLGAVTAGLVGSSGIDWKTAYIAGGVMGLVLLALRIGVYESGLYAAVKRKTVSRGNFFALFYPWPRLFKYLNCILIGLPIWFIVAIPITLSPELASLLGVEGKINAGTVIMYFYIGAVLGDFTSGFLSQLFKTRKKVVLVFMSLTAVGAYVFLHSRGITQNTFFLLAFYLGLFTGYWAVFVLMASEQFGTNLRATVTTSVPNFVRGGAVPLTLSFNYLVEVFGRNDDKLQAIVSSALIVGAVTFALAFFALWKLEETYGKELDYSEQ